MHYNLNLENFCVCRNTLFSNVHWTACMCVEHGNTAHKNCAQDELTQCHSLIYIFPVKYCFLPVLGAVCTTNSFLTWGWADRVWGGFE